MNKITPAAIQKFEFYSIFINNIFLLVGILLLNWTLFDTLFLYWLELLSACVVMNYLRLYIPIKYGRPGYQHHPEYRIPALQTIGLTTFALIMHYFALTFIIQLSAPNWDSSQGVLHTLAQLPIQLWNRSLIVLTLLFLVAYLLPSLILERRGIKPSMETMPIQSKIMTHPSQFVVTYLWFAVLWAMNHFGQISSPILLVTVLMLLKSAYEALLFFRIKNAF